MEKIFEILILRKNVILGILFIVSIGVCFAFVKGKIDTREKLYLEWKEKENILRTKEEGLKSIVDLEREYSQLAIELENLRREKEVPVSSYEETVDLITFFNTWAKMARISEIKLKSVKPVSIEGSHGKYGVEILLEGRYPDIFDFFSQVNRLGSLPKSARFEMKESERGYPILSMNVIMVL